MIRTKGEAGTGNVVEAVRHVRTLLGEIRKLQSMDEDELFVFAKEARIRTIFSWNPHLVARCGVRVQFFAACFPGGLAAVCRDLAAASTQHLRRGKSSPSLPRKTADYNAPPPPFLRPQIMAPLDLVRQTKALGRLPVVNFAAGGVATPADAAMMMQLGCDGVFVGSGIFKSSDPAARARAIVQAVTHFQDPAIIAEVCFLFCVFFSAARFVFCFKEDTTCYTSPPAPRLLLLNRVARVARGR